MYTYSYDVYRLGNGRYVCASLSGGQFIAPLSNKDMERTGCSASYARELEDLYTPSFKTAAYARAWMRRNGHAY